MSLSIVQNILETKLNAIWSSRTSIQWDNTVYIPKSAHIRPTLDQIGEKNLGLNCKREEYIFSIQLLVQTKIGTIVINTYSDDITNGFRNYAFGHLRCKQSVSKRVGSEKEWYQRNIDITVEYDNYI